MSTSTITPQVTLGKAAAAAGRDIEIPAVDGRMLAATLYEPHGLAELGAPVVVVAAGAGIARRFYGRFAAYLAEQGFTSVAFDVRDIGGSRSGPLKASRVRMRDWCVLDAPGVIAWATGRYPGLPLHWVGHSMGGFATGLAPNNHRIARQLNVATLSGYWGRMASPEKYRVYLMMGLLAPGMIAARGYMPGWTMGGEDMPGPAFMEWRRWCMTPGFLFDDATLPEQSNFPRLTAPLRTAQIADDPWGTPAAVDHMAQHFTGSPDRTIWRITPADAGVAKLGHFGFFRADVRDTVWKEAAAWLRG